MNVTLTLDDELVTKLERMAADQDTTLSGLVQAHLERLAENGRLLSRYQHDIRRLEDSFERFELHIGERTWTRADLHDRS